MARILGIHSEPLPHCLEGGRVLEAFAGWLPAAHAGRKRLLEACARSGVERRQSLLPLEEILGHASFSERNGRYAVAVRELGCRAARTLLERGGWDVAEFHTIVSVSCTGVMIPSAAVDLQAELGFSPGLRRLPITELGCVGGAVALSLAADLVSGATRLPPPRGQALGKDLALIVAAELPSLGFQPADLSPRNIIASAIFGDAVTAAVVGPGGRRGPQGTLAEGPEVVASLSCTVPGTADRLGYDLGSTGFHIVLSPELPALLRQAVPPLVDDLCRSLGWARSDVAHWIVHPGGEKVLRAIGEGLGLAAGALRASREVLAERGNTSSTGVFLVLERVAREARPGDLGVLIGLGPGVAAEAIAIAW